MPYPYLTIQELQDEINAYIFPNGQKKISGSNLNSILNGLVEFIDQNTGEFSQFFTTASFLTFSGSYLVDSGSNTVNYINISSSLYLVSAAAAMGQNQTQANVDRYTLTSSFNNFTASFTTTSASFDTRIRSISSSYSVDSASFASKITAISGSYVPLSVYNPFTASYTTDSASFSSKEINLSSSYRTFTSSYYLDSSSFDIRIRNITASMLSGSYILAVDFNAFTSSYNVASSSFSQRIDGINAQPFIFQESTGTQAANQIPLYTGNAKEISKGSSSFKYDPVSGTLTVRSISYRFPTSQGGANTFFRNDGNGNITWSDLNYLATTASFQSFTASYTVASSSFDTRINNLSSSTTATSASFNTRISNVTQSVTVFSQSYFIDSSSIYNTIIIHSESIYNISSSLGLIDTASFATTGSNLFRGNQTISGSVIIGYGNVASGLNSFVQGALNIASGSASFATGLGNVASGSYSHAEGTGSLAQGSYSHTEGERTKATGFGSHAEGYQTTASGQFAHAEGLGGLASNAGAHVEGYYGNTASGLGAHAEGASTLASGFASHAEGNSTQATGNAAHAEGIATIAQGDYSHAEGNGCFSPGSYSHAEGYHAVAAGQNSHAEGYFTLASGAFSHAEGNQTIAVGQYSHASGFQTIASGSYQTVLGQFNTKWNDTSLFVIGNGTGDGTRRDLARFNSSSVEFTASFLVSGSGSFQGTVGGADALKTTDYITLGQFNGLSAGFGDSTIFNTFTSSYYVTSNSFDSRIKQNVTGAIGQVAIFTGPNSVSGSSLLYQSGSDLTFNVFGAGGGFPKIIFGSSSLSTPSTYCFVYGRNNAIAPSGGAGTNILLGSGNAVGSNSFVFGYGLAANNNQILVGYGTNDGTAATSTSRIAFSGNVIQLITQETERLRCDNSGSVMIGSATGTGVYKLQVITGSTAVAAKFVGRVIGSDAVNTTEFATLGQLNSFTTTSSFQSFTGSYITDSASFSSRETAASSSLFAVSNSYKTDSSSFDSRITLIAAGSPVGLTTTSSFQTFTASYVAASSSFNTRITNVFTSESKYLLTSSYLTDSASFDDRIINVQQGAGGDWYRLISGSATAIIYKNGDLILTSGSKDGGAHLIVSGSGSFTGEVLASAYFETSLRSSKENIFPFSSSALDIINSIDVMTFNYKNNKSGFKIGIIADDTHEYISTPQHNKFDIKNTIGLLLKAVQELSKKLDEKS